MLKYQGNILKIANSTVDYTAPVPPPYPADMDFIYLAKDFDGSKIPNLITTSDMGPYLKEGTLTVNGSGQSCYLSNGLSGSNYLYIDLTNERLNAMKANSGTYSFFFRVMQNTSSGVGGIISWRGSGASYVYMLRCENNQVQVHTISGNNLGTSNFSLATDNVYKVVVSGNSYSAKNLSTNATWSLTDSSTRNMSARMLSFSADYSNANEAKLDRFYGIAGIARATTAEEDAVIKDILMNQSA